MDAAKKAVDKVLHRSGHHDTHVEETVNPAITQETVKPTRHEETISAVDKETHQHHYHTTVQPITDRQVLPEQHRHQELPVQEREFRHGDDTHVKRAVGAEAAQFQDSSRTIGTAHTTSQAPAVAGEHVHHHVHENVQPVIHKETITPEVVHTVQPIHEKHQAPSEHHGMSVLPAKDISELKATGQNLAGSTHRTEHYEGDPRSYDPKMQVKQHDVDSNFNAHDGLHTTGNRSAGATAAGLGSSGGTTGVTGSSGTRSADVGTTNTSGSHNPGMSSTVAHNYPSDNSKSQGLGSRIGHGITNQLHHGSERDNVDRNILQDDVQHGTQPRDPAVIDSRGEKKLTGSGIDGSHSAVFGLTPDGHQHEDTHHGTGTLRPAHSKDVSNTTDRRDQQALAEQMNDIRITEKGHGGSGMSTTGTAKPGAGAPGGEQGFGQIRPGEHGTTDKIQNKLDPTTDADRDGKRGVMD